MCGRFTITSDAEKLEERFEAKVEKSEYKKRYNAAPSQLLPVITKSDKKNVQFFKWGLIPFWAKEEKIGYQLINARAETVTEKPSFKYALKERRCLVLADGYYELMKTPEGKIPFRITLKDEILFAFAGIWEEWESSNDRVIKSFSIVTVPASSTIRDIHGRMPAILTPEEEQNWIGNIETTEAVGLLNSYQGELLSNRVSKLVNSPKNDSEEVLNPEFIR